MAQRLHDRIEKNSKTIGITSTLTPTKRARHAIELAQKISLSYKQPLIVSVSGDGGYNEVINGVMIAKSHSDSVLTVVAVMGAGNANDHRRVVRDADTSLYSLIKQAKPKPLDLLKMDVSAKSSDDITRYAHSYIGFGISPYVAVELNRHELNFFQELKIIVRSFMKYEPFVIEYNGKKRTLDSLLFANINEMGKVLKLHQKKNIHDGKFELIEFRHAGKLKLLAIMALAAIRGLRDQSHHKSYSFNTVAAHPVQLDGEVVKIPNNASVTIRSINNAIESLY